LLFTRPWPQCILGGHIIYLFFFLKNPQIIIIFNDIVVNHYWVKKFNVDCKKEEEDNDDSFKGNFDEVTVTVMRSNS
jgi:hypothetical protein